MEEIRYCKHDDARDNALIQLTHWLDDVELEQEFLEREYRRISSNPARMALLVRKEFKGEMKIALFVNPVVDNLISSH